MCDLPIRQDLLALPGAAERDQNGHQRRHWRSQADVKLHHFATQSLGATQQMPPLCGGTGRPNPGSYRFRRATKLYGLQILAEAWRGGRSTTRFIVIEKRAPSVAGRRRQRLSMLFTVDHKPGGWRR